MHEWYCKQEVIAWGGWHTYERAGEFDGSRGACTVKALVSKVQESQ